MGQNGGKRPGAGRKKGAASLAAEKYREFLVAEVAKKKGPLVKALIEKGLTGDIPALKEIHDRALGKSKESLDITTKGEKVTGFQYVVPKDEKGT